MPRVPLALPTARKRLLNAALNQSKPSPELVAAINELLHTVRHPLALKDERAA